MFEGILGSVGFVLFCRGKVYEFRLYQKKYISLFPKSRPPGPGSCGAAVLSCPGGFLETKNISYIPNNVCFVLRLRIEICVSASVGFQRNFKNPNIFFCFETSFGNGYL